MPQLQVVRGDSWTQPTPVQNAHPFPLPLHPAIWTAALTAEVALSDAKSYFGIFKMSKEFVTDSSTWKYLVLDLHLHENSLMFPQKKALMGIQITIISIPSPNNFLLYTQTRYLMNIRIRRLTLLFCSDFVLPLQSVVNSVSQQNKQIWRFFPTSVIWSSTVYEITYSIHSFGI